MQLTVNGEQKEYAEDSLTMTQLLVKQRVESPEMVAVQVNGEFVAQQQYDELPLRQGDTVEFLYFMGGGAA
jgi:sulfur carrier protein